MYREGTLIEFIRTSDFIDPSDKEPATDDMALMTTVKQILYLRVNEIEYLPTEYLHDMQASGLS